MLFGEEYYLTVSYGDQDHRFEREEVPYVSKRKVYALHTLEELPKEDLLPVARFKVKDGVYIVSLLETLLCRTRGHGNSLLFLMNLNEMHDVGRSFGTNDKGEDENYVFGAFGCDFDAHETLERKSTFHIR